VPKVITTAPTWRQVEHIGWPQIRSLVKGSRLPIISPSHGHNDTPLQQTQIKLDDEWFAMGVSTARPEDFEGWHAENLMFILDEAKGLDQWVFDSAEGLLGVGTQLKMIATSTPGRDSGPFFASFSSSEWKKFTVDYTQVKRRGGLDRWAKRCGEMWGVESSIYKSKVLAQFYEDQADCLVPLEWIERARAGNDVDWKGQPVVVGVDVARHGDDRSVILVFQGGRIQYIKILQGADVVAVAGAAKAEMLKWGASLGQVDSIGVGAGVFDLMKSWGLPVREFKASRKPRDKERFRRLRDESFWALRERFREGLIDLSQITQKQYDLLSGELHRVKFNTDEMGRICIESKDEYRKRDGKLRGEDNAKSPDIADALMIAASKLVALVFDYDREFSAKKRKYKVAM